MNNDIVFPRILQKKIKCEATNHKKYLYYISNMFFHLFLDVNPESVDIWAIGNQNNCKTVKIKHACQYRSLISKDRSLIILLRGKNHFSLTDSRGSCYCPLCYHHVPILLSHLCYHPILIGHNGYENSVIQLLLGG